MQQNQLDQIMYATVAMVCDELTDAELAAMNLCAQLGMNPKGRNGYDKAHTLFTEQDGTKMHEETKRALAAVVLERLA